MQYILPLHVGEAVLPQTQLVYTYVVHTSVELKERELATQHHHHELEQET